MKLSGKNPIILIKTSYFFKIIGFSPDNLKISEPDTIICKKKIFRLARKVLPDNIIFKKILKKSRPDKKIR